MNLTLTFDSMTLTLLSLVALTNVCPHTKWRFIPTNSSWEINKNIYFLNVKLTLTFDQMTLTFYLEIVLINVYPHTKFG